MQREQLVELVIIPTLREIPHGLTAEAMMAITMIIAHESLRGHYLKQDGGPALGLGCMEPLTHNETWKWGATIWKNSFHMGIINEVEFEKKLHPLPGRMVYDLRYAVFMMRQRLFMKTERFPKTAYQMSDYLKRHWNSTQGKADSNSYLNDYNLWVK